MSSENHTKVVTIPYPGRDLAILSLCFLLFAPVIGFILARQAIDEARARDYSQIGIQRAAYALNGLMIILQLLLILAGVLLGWFDPMLMTIGL